MRPCIFFAYLDEFGHIGPYLKRSDLRYNESPVFGLGGFILPATGIRSFDSWFYERKCQLLEFEIARSGRPAHLWEKKGSALYTPRNINRYQQLRRFTNRFLNQMTERGGFIFYCGFEKPRTTSRHDSAKLYMDVLWESIKRLNQEAEKQKCQFAIFMDEHQQRHRIITEASRMMFNRSGDWAADNLIEPPFQIESHRYQTAQAADWVCGLVGRWSQYKVAQDEWPEMACVEKYFQKHLLKAQRCSDLRMLRGC